MSKYYDLDKFKEANQEFESYIEKFITETDVRLKFTKLNISTITVISEIAKKINIKIIYDRLKLDDEFVYVTYQKNNIRGIKTNIKKKKKITQKKKVDKRKLKNGYTFSNQITIGYDCKHHKHKNPISIKLFKNGSLQMTGCKTKEEITYIYEKLYEKITSIQQFYMFGDIKIKINESFDLVPPKYFDYKTEMLIGTVNSNYNLKQSEINDLIISKYQIDTISTTYEENIQSPLRLYLKNYSDIISGKERVPVVFVYSSGAINIMSHSFDNIYKTEKFIKKLFTKNSNKIVDIDYEFDLLDD